MTKKAAAKVLAIVKNYIDALARTDTGQPLPVGYNPIEAIRGALFHWVAVPFNGRDIWCQLRCPNATQLEQCGDMTNIILKKDGDEKYSYDETIKIRNYQEEICKLVLNIPTFDHISQLVGDSDFVMSEKRNELQKIQKYFDGNKESMTETEKAAAQTRIKTLTLMLGFLVPDDAMAFLCRWAMGNDVSDIKKITRGNLLKAAALAKAHNKAPTDYLSGVFTDFNRQEIDNCAFMVLEEHLNDRRAADSGNHNWLLGGNKSKARLPKQPGKKQTAVD